MSVRIATDATLALDDLQQPRLPINELSLAATQEGAAEPGFAGSKAVAC